MPGQDEIFIPPNGDLVNVPLPDQERINAIVHRFGRMPDGKVYVHIPNLGWVPTDKVVMMAHSDDKTLAVPPLPVHGYDLLGIMSCGVGENPEGRNIVKVRGATIGRIDLLNAGHTDIIIAGGDYPKSVVSLVINWKADGKAQFRQSLAITVQPDFEGQTIDIKFNHADAEGLLLVAESSDPRIRVNLDKAIQERSQADATQPNAGIIGTYQIQRTQ